MTRHQPDDVSVHEDTALISEKAREKTRPAGRGFFSLKCVVAAVVTLVIVGRFALLWFTHNVSPALPHISVAFIGNSMMYFNDLPRFMEALSEGHITQNSCMHGLSSLESILRDGNGMYDKFHTSNALDDNNIYDFGACTVPQLLFGYDASLEQRVIAYKHDKNSDTSNPCIQDEAYMAYLEHYYATTGTPHWDFILVNDYSRNPGRPETFKLGMKMLKEVYVPWFKTTGAIPVFLDTHAYSTPEFTDIASFTSLTYHGIEKYAALVERLLPEKQKPRIAPVGIAYLTVWEENLTLWKKLFHSDCLHASPLGTFLQGCVVHYTLFGKMPRTQVFHDNVASLWSRARMMQPPDASPNPFPTPKEADFLYQVAHRVARGYRPRAFT